MDFRAPFSLEIMRLQEHSTEYPFKSSLQTSIISEENFKFSANPVAEI